MRKGATKREDGSAVMEVAVALPFFVLMLLAIGVVAWIFWTQTAATIASIEAARYSAYRWDQSIAISSGTGPFYDAMSGIGSSQAASFVGLPQISANWTTRSVSVFVQRGATFSAQGVTGTYTFSSGAYTRIQDFFGGPPSPWE
jgi:Flp pilus assembly protein TadG